MIDNLINGNLADARKQAKRYSAIRICHALIEMGWNKNKAFAATAYLKTGLRLHWQEYCDAK